MVPGKYNIVCPQGSTYSQRFTYHIDESPVNLTTYTARMQVRETHSSDIKVFDLTTANGGIVLGGSLGTIDVSISATDTAAVVAKNYVYDLELVNGSVVTRIVEGQFIVTPEVTR